ncbi:SRPBCC family protein [Nocardioides sp. B-3]|uniref:SRPBCC family protein n=1 Tax=Nocardioides sp. B-3 TaxID=2895565 RepID=UPI0021531592|nr:SRPBCC family protein [Nocardioides sp. B-3]UUZ58037.1 SRPBCC family protein [Nocardioides sp. B-3]
MRAFHFESTWEVVAPLADVHAVLVDPEHYPDWWPQVLAVAKIDDETARVLCRSTLPYTLDPVLGAVHREPTLLETTISGDPAGSVRWRLTAIPGGTRLDYEQEVDVTARPGPPGAPARAGAAVEPRPDDGRVPRRARAGAGHGAVTQASMLDMSPYRAPTTASRGTAASSPRGRRR